MSSQIIAYTDRIEFKTLLDIQCKGITGIAPVVKDNTEDFTSFLNLLGEIDILIIDQPKTKKDYSFLLQAVQDKEDSIKNIILISDESLKTTRSLVFPQNQVEKVIEHIRELLSSSESSYKDGYISVPIDSFLHFKLLPFDLYIKLSADKFIKRIHANEDIDENTIRALKEKGVAELFFGRKYNREFSLLLLNNMINKVERDYDTLDQKLRAKSQVFVTTQEIVQSVGLPPRVIEVCESVMDSISVDVLKGKDKLSTYLTQMKQTDLSFNYRFVELTSFIAVQLVEAHKFHGQPEEIRKIVFAAFFADISLSDPSQIECRSNDSLKDLWPEDQKVILEHALKSSQVVSKYKNAPLGADEIIKQHHGSVTGVGLGKISDQILPLSRCLMASQEIALGLLKNEGTSPGKVVEDLIQKFENTCLKTEFVLFRDSCQSQL